MAENKITMTNLDTKKLAIMVCDFLLGESLRKDLPKSTKSHIDKATDCLEKVYKIKIGDYPALKKQRSLQELFNVGFKPVPIKNRKKAEKHKKKGSEYMNARSYELAEVEFTKALEFDKTNPIYFCNRAASKVQQGITLAAIEDCTKALELDPKYVKAYNLLGLVHALMDRPARALRCYRKSLKIDPNNAVSLANVDYINARLDRATFKVPQPLTYDSYNFINEADIIKKKKEAKTNKQRKMHDHKEKVGDLFLEKLD